MAEVIAEQTVRALPMIIEGVRAKGDEIVPLHELMGKTKADVMPADSDQRTLGCALGLDGLRALGFQHPCHRPGSSFSATC